MINGTLTIYKQLLYELIHSIRYQVVQAYMAALGAGLAVNHITCSVACGVMSGSILIIE